MPMNTTCRAFWRSLALVALVSAPYRALTQTADWSLATLDKILAGVPPGQKLAQVGDMQILVSNLQTWRNHLAGRPAPNLAFDGTAPTWTGGNVSGIVYRLDFRDALGSDF